ncbi:MAG: hypothetical protein AMXMBFR83_03860 [Phycisphaerae bacterium]
MGAHGAPRAPFNWFSIGRVINVMRNAFPPRVVVALATVLALWGGALSDFWPMSAAAEPVAAEGGGQAKAVSKPVRYGRDIRPILSDRCFKCHGPDPKTRAADLRLDEREAAIAPRGPITPIVPGKPEASELWRRVNSHDPEEQMPPPNSNKRSLSPEERELVRRWIEEGAVYEPHWAFQPATRPALPEVRRPAWARNPIDTFILARLEEEGLTPSPEAERETLIRRLFLDVTGLPPTPEEIDAFLADNRPDAYERWVDKLMAEEPYRTRYAERMAVPWMDAARYADTCGIHMDAGRQMWLWRDWVLKAFRDNKPFNDFVTEQIAGDLLPGATDDQKIASGFNRNHVTTDEGGAISEEYLVEYAVDRANTTGSVFLGLSVGCGRCHEHKYDPISQEEYYKFYAYFNSIDEPGLYSQLPNPNRAFEPFMAVPTPEQKARLAELRGQVASIKAAFSKPRFQDDVEREAYILDKQRKTGLVWEPTQTVAAGSTYGATLTIQPDESVLAGGANPPQDEHFLTLRTEGRDLRLLMLEALTDPSLPQGRVGRADNGNAVLNGIEVEARSVADPSKREAVRLVWAWADVEQPNDDHGILNVLNGNDDLGWAVAGHERGGGRVALLLADKPFGFEGGTELAVRLMYDSRYAQHTLGRVRITAGRFADEGLDLLPAAAGGWFQIGPFKAKTRQAAYETAFGPEKDAAFNPRKRAGGQAWRFAAALRDGQVNPLGEGGAVSYVGRRVISPTDRKVEVTLGTSDGYVLFVNGKRVAGRDGERKEQLYQDKAVLDLKAGENSIILKVIATDGAGSFFFQPGPRGEELFGDLVAALVPQSARPAELKERLGNAWRLAYSPGYRKQKELLASLERQIPELENNVPLTMVMQELPKPRPTFLLVRGQYDKPDKNRPIQRGIPAALGKLPENAPPNRLGLAQWLTSPQNPLVARVAVNRLWEMLFGTGLVTTSEDFGLQGDWPSHPELLDWLAVEFREKGWNVQYMLKLMLTSSTYRQMSRVRPELRERDPNNRLLAYFPRRRLSAEFIRDEALYVSGLLVEKMGGPSVKPYQPDGLWQEVAMTQSNTRYYKRGDGEDLWRRSLYTYWKRACPPPSLMTFDAPTREACTIRRPSTNTPLQALVLWNDEQFVEAARVLAQRTLKEAQEDRQRLTRMFRRCTGRTPVEEELGRLMKALGEFRERYGQAPDDAARLIEVGESPTAKDVAPAELAAWTMIANALLNLSATITQS